LGVVADIPARYASNRFPGKVLVARTGRYLVQHVYESVRQAARVDRVIVATDDQRVMDAVASFGGEARMTRPDHPSGTDRVAEVAAELDDGVDVILNVQGDEPEIDPAHVDRLVEVLCERETCVMATLACPFPEEAEPADPNCVKVVLDQRGRALYFSRSLIPFVRSDGPSKSAGGRWLLHMGIYAYRRAFLGTIAGLTPTPLEQAERLEQLRVLEHGYELAVGVVDRAPAGIDTPEEYDAFVHRAMQLTR
jgi:3-deoxy-manno-octulosonate cytidylyltransferase (CMP-KDO synthetase)